METESIILEHLRAIRSELAELKDGQREIVHQIVALRAREYAQDGDINRHDRQIFELQEEIDRIKRRLDLVD